MSRTIRRKNAKHELCDHTTANKKALNEFHSDCGKHWMRNAPSAFRKRLNRSTRSKQIVELNRINNIGDYWEYEFDPIFKNANWY